MSLLWSIRDQDTGGDDELRFTAADSGQVKAKRDGQDMIVEIRNDSGVLVSTTRLIDQFLGELNPYLSNGKQLQSGVNQIVFSDGVIRDRFCMAMQVASPRDTNDVYAGSGSGDVLWGGKGNDVLTGGAGGGIYIFQRGDGQDVISERGGFSFGPGSVPQGWRRGAVRRKCNVEVNDNQTNAGGRAVSCIVNGRKAA